MNRVIVLLQNFIAFIKNPSKIIHDERSTQQKVIEVGVYYGIISVVWGIVKFISSFFGRIWHYPVNRVKQVGERHAQ